MITNASPVFGRSRRVRWLGSLVAVAAISLFAGTAQAEQPSARASVPSALVVWLKNGAVVRGDLVELVPGDHVTLRLATGAVRTYSWAEVKDTAGAGEPAATADSVSERATSGQPSKTAAEGNAGTAHVRIVLEADDIEATLEQAEAHLGSSESSSVPLDVTLWKRVCTVPCAVSVPTNTKYRVAGDGVRPSEAFPVTPGSDYHLRANVGSQRRYNMGAYFGLASLATLGVGLSSYVVVHGAANDSGGVRDYTISYVCFGLGAVALAISVPLMLTSGTSVRTKNGEHMAKGVGARVASLASGGMRW